MLSIDSSIKENAIKFRKKGYSLQEIADRYKIAKSTASLWLKNIKLDKKAQLRINNRIKIGQIKTKEIKLEKKRMLLEKFRQEAHADILQISSNKIINRLICAILFWCEGNKTMTQIKFTNSDPEMIKYFLALFRSGFTVDESKFRALVHLHEYHNETKQIDFWSKLTKIPKNQFHQSFKKPHTKKTMRENYPGCICVTYFDAKLAKKLWSYYKEAPKILGA